MSTKSKEAIQPEDTSILEPQDFGIIYECLNGKGTSCVTGREIDVAKINCSLSAVFMQNSRKIIKAIKDMEKSETEKNKPDDLYDKICETIKNTLTRIFFLDRKDVRQYYDTFISKGMAQLVDQRMLIPIGKNTYALNFSDVTKFVAPKLHAMYGDSSLYSSSVMFEPPAERQPNVLRLQLTDGCDYGQCTYCDGYGCIQHSQKTEEQFKDHVDDVVEYVRQNRIRITRVFLGSGNGLHVDQKLLKKSIEYVDSKFRPQRIALYANTRALLKKNADELEELRRVGLGCIYRGAETGSDELLKYVNKGSTFDEMLKAGETLDKTGIAVSVMLMPGLGGKRFDEEHVNGTAELLNSIIFKYVTLMTINPPKDSTYKKIMEKEETAGTNRPLSKREIVQQVRNILAKVEPKGQKIGMFGGDVDIVGANPIDFRVVFDAAGKREVLDICDEYLFKMTVEEILGPEDDKNTL